MIVTNGGRGGRLPSVPDRGSALNGSSYAALAPAQAPGDEKGLQSSASSHLHYMCSHKKHLALSVCAALLVYFFLHMCAWSILPASAGCRPQQHLTGSSKNLLSSHKIKVWHVCMHAHMHACGCTAPRR